MQTQLSSKLPIQPAAPIESGAPMATVTSKDVPFGIKEGEDNLAANTAKKGVNWILIGGVAIGAYFIFKYLKKK